MSPIALIFGLTESPAAWRSIVEAIDEHKFDLLVIGTHGRRGVERLFLGSVAEKVVRAAPVPVLTVHAPPPPIVE